MYPLSESGPVWLAAWVQLGGVSYQAQIVEANGADRTAQVIRLGTLIEQQVPFAALSSVALKSGSQVMVAFGRPPAATVPAWVRYAEVAS